MSIKNLFVLAFASAAAALSLTGCGDNVDSHGTFNVTAAEFAGGSRSFYTVRTRSLEIIPVQRIMGTIGVESSSINFTPSGDPEDMQQHTINKTVNVQGTVGVRGMGITYQAEFLYSTSDDGYGALRFICTDSRALDDDYLIAACGYAFKGNNNNNWSNGWNNNNNSDTSNISRATISHLDDIDVKVYFDFNTGMAYVQGAATGYEVSYTDEEGNEHNGFSSEELISSNIVCDFRIEKH